MPNLIPFPASCVRRLAARLVILTASRDTLSAPLVWRNRPAPPERLGNMLQHLARRRPVLVLLFENLIAEVLAQIDPAYPRSPIGPCESSPQMKPKSVLLALALAVSLAPPLAAQSLVEASEAAKKVKHDWPLSLNVGPADATPAAPVLVSTPAPSTTAPLPKAPPKQDEAYWRARVAPLHASLDANVAQSRTLSLRIDDLTIELLGIHPFNTRRGGVEAERQRLITERQARVAALIDDQRAIDAVEEEGRRARALPGWFR